MTDNLKIYIETYGCQMNEYDSELVRSILSDKGHSLTNTEDDADVVLLNTCAIRENAHTKIYHRLQQLKSLKAKRKYSVTVGIIGCMAQNLRDELLDSHHEVDFIAGPDSYRELPRLIGDNRLGGEKGYALKLSRTETYSGVNPIRSGGVNAWVAVMRGCDNMCTFCVVPYTRGRERSRDAKGIVAEVESLAQAGCKQVTLLGQNVNSYRCQGYDFADLMRMTADVPGVERVRFTSPHPKDFPETLLEVISTHPHVCKHIHLPIQAGSDRLLELMRRTYDVESFKRLVTKMRRLIPGVAISTDIIVGFPTETDAEFGETYSVMEEVRFDFAFIFKYSERKGTYAARKLRDDVSASDKTERIVRLVDLQKRITGEINRQFVGQTLQVLVEERSKKEPGSLLGKTDTFKSTVFAGEGYQIGDLVEVAIERSRGGTLFGRAVGLSGGARRPARVAESIGSGAGETDTDT
ncbi:MAG: tRNA (N6-isopentenyl adenosine(37)-C2)-methylthiotransferase MiaB [Candidatus Krumholzibacteria bacterium]|nr:tRNA (N6-isopentenyl adenosine(37)-C2)-methylthiotransferase MiaB [Candidatus Krumholzibacteria bacterium]